MKKKSKAKMSKKVKDEMPEPKMMNEHKKMAMMMGAMSKMHGKMHKGI